MLKQTCIVIFILSSGCNACVNQFYGTNGHSYLDIIFEDPSINYSLTTYYVDSVLNKDIHFPDSIKSKFYISDIQTDLYEGDRLIHFEERPEEWYLVELLGGQSVIEAIYNPKISANAIFDKKELSESQLTRIKNRMQTEIINQMELYGRKNHIPDFTKNKTR